jgi:hypothetical protein
MHVFKPLSASLCYGLTLPFLTGIGFFDIGEQQVKNIMRPFRVYQVMLGGAGTQAPMADRTLPSRVKHRRHWWAVGAALALAGIVAAWVLPRVVCLLREWTLTEMCRRPCTRPRRR